ncbi:hypothetical protein BC941DRAFT_410535 [Chlamydoabsidia padenii]|nr:hypothetical protein BC941DRAFT_410535 [Chlamydoabsidia padenii]
MENATPTNGNDPLTSPVVTDGTTSNGNSKPPSFLQRIASSDTIFRPASPKKRPSTSNLHKSSSSSALQQPTTQSFSIPIPSNSWGMKALSQLQDSFTSDYDDIVDLLLDGDKAVLLLPVSRPTHPSVHIDLEFIKDHVIIHPPQGKSHVMSLSGIRGVFQKDQFVALDLSSSEYDITFSLAKSDGKRSPFDALDLDPTSITSDHPVCNILATHVPVKLRDHKTIKVMLIQKPLSKSDVMDWMRNRQNSETATTTHSTTSSLPLKSAPLDDPLAPTVDAFLKAYRQRPPKTMTMASEQWADFLDDLGDSMDNSAGNNVDDRLDIIESYMCRELYDKLFIAGASDDSFQDEVLESRIAAVNLLDLNLGHLGVTVDSIEVESIANMVNTAGTQLQQLNSIPGAKEKLDILVKTHQIIVDAIERFAEQQKDTSINTDLEVVQEMKHAMSAVNDVDNSRTNTKSTIANQSNQAITKKISTDTASTIQHDDNSDNSESHKGTDSDNVETAIDSNDTSSSTSIPASESAPEQTNLGAASADVLLPLLIFTIVKSNPTNFMSNLKFIQRFRHPSRLNGQASYCLTNILAAVSFLETTNLVGLGLSVDKVHSNVTDLNALIPTPLPSNQSGQPATTTSSSGAGMKLVSEVMDSSYRVFDGIGRFWQQRNNSDVDASTTTLAPSSQSSSTSTYGNNSKTHHGISPSELKDMATSVMGLAKSKKDLSPPSSQREASHWDKAIPGFLEQRKTSIKPSRSSSTTSTSSKTDHFQAIFQAPSQFIQSVQQKSNKHSSHDAPIQKFMDIKTVDELTIGDVGELLADYKRLAAILKQSNVLQ